MEDQEGVCSQHECEYKQHTLTCTDIRLSYCKWIYAVRAKNPKSSNIYCTDHPASECKMAIV